MTAPDELKPLLDERGIEYYAMPTINGTNYYFGWVAECGGYTKCVGVQGDCYYAMWEHLTPAQAIEVTLGRRTCKQVLVDCDDGLMPPFTAHCSACGSEWGFTPKYCPECGAMVVGTRDD